MECATQPYWITVIVDCGVMYLHLLNNYFFSFMYVYFNILKITYSIQQFVRYKLHSAVSLSVNLFFVYHNTEERFIHKNDHELHKNLLNEISTSLISNAIKDEG